MTPLTAGQFAVPVEGDELALYKRHFPTFRNAVVRFKPAGWIMPTPFLKYADALYNFPYRKSDVVVVGYPKCGSTWMQEIVWTMRNNPDLDNPKAHDKLLNRSPFLDFDMFADNVDATKSKYSYQTNNGNALDELHAAKSISFKGVHNTPDPRTLKNHLPFSLSHPSLLEKAKVIYVARNPKDVVVSYHHHCLSIKFIEYHGTFHQFVKLFTDDALVYSPYWLHVKEAWERRHHPNLHFVFYEDLKVDVMKELKKLNTFLDTKLTDAQLNNVARHTSFKEMRHRTQDRISNSISFTNTEYTKNHGGFFRKGQIGDWKERLSEKDNEAMDRWIAEKMDPIGITFKYSL